MKSSLCFAAVLLNVASVFASPLEERSQGVVVAAPQFEGSAKDRPSSCSSGFTVTLTVPISSSTPDTDFDFFTFCSAFLQPTVTIIKATTIPTTSTIAVATTTAQTETTQTITSKGTVTSLCPIASPTSRVCGSQAWGHVENNIYFAQPLDPADCHQLCLENEACNSFQVQNSSYPFPQCSLYNTTASANDTIVGNAPFLFYDWDCPDYLPAQCKHVVTTVITTYLATANSPPLPTAPARIQAARAPERRSAAYATLPDFLVPFGSSSITNVCNCIITSPSPTVLITQLTGVPIVVDVSVTKTAYTVYTVTDRPGYSTVISSVS